MYAVRIIRVLLPEHHIPIRIQSYQNKNQYRKGKQGRAAIADERQWNPNDRKQADGHADINGNVHEQNGGNAVCIHTAKYTSLPLGNMNDADKQEEIDS